MRHNWKAMDSRPPLPSSSCDAGLGAAQTEAEQDPSLSWLDLVDWTLLDADGLVGRDFESIKNGDNPENYEFHGFDGRFLEGDRAGIIQQHHSTRASEHSDSDARINEEVNVEPGWFDSSLDLDNKVSNDDRSGEAWWPGRGRNKTLGVSAPSGRSAAYPSPSPRRKGRLSDLVRRGMEELKHAKGACWRCKILRKKVSRGFKQDH